jgi:hypothetical protein
MRGWLTGVDPEPPDAAERATPSDRDCAEPPAPDDTPDDDAGVIGERRARIGAALRKCLDCGSEGATPASCGFVTRRLVGHIAMRCPLPARSRSIVNVFVHGSSDAHPPAKHPAWITPIRHPPVLTASSWPATASSWLSNGRLLRGTSGLSPAPRCAHGRDGLSFYAHHRLSAALGMSSDTYRQARQGLLHRNLIAADGVRVHFAARASRTMGWP